MGTLTVRLYLLLIHSIFPQYQHEQPACDFDRITADQCQYGKSLQGPITFTAPGPLRLEEYMFLQKEKNTNL